MAPINNNHDKIKKKEEQDVGPSVLRAVDLVLQGDEETTNPETIEYPESESEYPPKTKNAGVNAVTKGRRTYKNRRAAAAEATAETEPEEQQAQLNLTKEDFIDSDHFGKKTDHDQSVINVVVRRRCVEAENPDSAAFITDNVDDDDEQEETSLATLTNAENVDVHADVKYTNNGRPAKGSVLPVGASRPGAYAGAPGERYARNASILITNNGSSNSAANYNNGGNGDTMNMNLCSANNERDRSATSWVSRSETQRLDLEDPQHPFEGNEDAGGLVNARPVADSSIFINLPTAVEHNGGDETQERPSGIKKIVSVLGLLGVIVLIGVVFLVVFLLRRPSSDVAIGNGLGAENVTVAPTLTFEEETLEDHIKSLLPDYTRLDINSDDALPQSQAYTWLIKDPFISNYSDRRIVQRFALATFFYATGGSTKWRTNTTWLDYEKHECSWAATDYYFVAETFEYRAVNEGPVFPNTKFMEHSNPCEEVDLDNIPTDGGVYKHILHAGNNLQNGIPDEMYLLTDLRTISLLNMEDLGGSISSRIGDLSKLELFSFVLNPKITGTVPTEFGRLDALSHFILIGSSPLTGSVPTELFGLTKLKWCQLDHHQLTGTISSLAGQLTELTTFSLSNSRLKGTVPTELGLLTKLRDLQIFDSKLSGTIPSEIANLTRLWRLGMDMNQLTGTIPSWLGSMNDTLEELVLFSNPFTPAPLPSELGLLTRLAHLNVASTGLTGNLPVEMENLSHLKELNVTQNQLTGPLPGAVFDWIHNGTLKTLDVSGNFLSGSVPASTCDLLSEGNQTTTVQGLDDCTDNFCGCGCTACL